MDEVFSREFGYRIALALSRLPGGLEYAPEVIHQYIASGPGVECAQAVTAGYEDALVLLMREDPVVH